jgi:hypothetical protein
MNLKNYILMIRTFFVGCIFFLCAAFAYREPGYCKMVDQITKKFLKECAQPRRLMLSCYGGAMMNDIQNITLRFLSFDALNVDEARMLYVEIMEEYLQRINCHERIRPHLHNFPFEENNIKLSIGFENSKRKITRDGHVAMIFISKNHTIYYDAYDPITEEFYTLHRESYEEALRFVKEHSTCELK